MFIEFDREKVGDTLFREIGRAYLSFADIMHRPHSSPQLFWLPLRTSYFTSIRGQRAQGMLCVDACVRVGSHNGMNHEPQVRFSDSGQQNRILWLPCTWSAYEEVPRYPTPEQLRDLLLSYDMRSSIEMVPNKQLVSVKRWRQKVASALIIRQIIYKLITIGFYHWSLVVCCEVSEGKI